MRLLRRASQTSLSSYLGICVGIYSMRTISHMKANASDKTISYACNTRLCFTKRKEFADNMPLAH